MTALTISTARTLIKQADDTLNQAQDALMEAVKNGIWNEDLTLPLAGDRLDAVTAGVILAENNTVAARAMLGNLRGRLLDTALDEQRSRHEVAVGAV